MESIQKIDLKLPGRYYKLNTVYLIKDGVMEMTEEPEQVDMYL